MKIEQISLKHKNQILEMCTEYNLNNEDYNGAFFINDITDYEEKIKELDNASKGILDNPSFVPYTCYVFIIEDKIVGVGSIRHYLNDYLKNYGGHIGYSIRPSERKKGFGKMALNLLLKEIAKKDIKEVIVTCNSNNIGSQKVIEGNNGILVSELEQNGKIIYKYNINL